MLSQPQARKGLSQIELLAVILVLAVLFFTLVSVMSGALKMARASQCGSNLRQLGLAMTLHIQENDGYLPVSYWNTQRLYWHSQIPLEGLEDQRDGGVFSCPANEYSWGHNAGMYNGNYAWNIAFGRQFYDDQEDSIDTRVRYQEVSEASTSIIIADANVTGAFNPPRVTFWFSPGNAPTHLGFHHQNGQAAHVLYLDGHVGAVTPDEARNPDNFRLKRM